jgi:hypothetical protein
MDNYRSLNADRLVETLGRLNARVFERFSDRGIAGVCSELASLAPGIAETAASLSRPIWLLRFAVFAVLAVGLLLVGRLAWLVELDGIDTEGFRFFEGLEALINVLLLSGAGVWFLLSLETRIKRARALEKLHELRSIAHVIDIHQLTKTPVQVLEGGDITASSPSRDLTPFQLRRYLDYCSEMLSLTGKLAALYLAHSKDPVTIQAVNEIEELTSDFSRKIWQKISVM